VTELVWHSPMATSLLLGLLGCCVGSFINVVVYRLPIMRQRSEDTSGFNLAWPPSSCPRCGIAIKTQQNLPIISYLWLGGRSACCQEHISRRYIATEISAGLLTAGISFWLLNHQLDMSRVSALLLPTLLLVWWLVAIAGMLWHSSEDTKTLWQSLLWLGLLTASQQDAFSLSKAIFGVCLIYFLALLWRQSSIFLGRKDAPRPTHISQHSLDPSWHSLAALAAWFTLPDAEALAIGFAVAAAWGLWTARTDHFSTKPTQWGARAIQLMSVVTFAAAWALILADL
jgi:prepilin signal peptidase PulO-like enzyme (type II secretory pathway)